jgi:CheY-like chemotaxis protein/two-component sensor histidine kinase
VAHDFNNMLGVILGRTDLMVSQAIRQAPAVVPDLMVIKQAALDGAETVKRLQAFSGVKRLPQNETADANEVVHDAIELTRARWRDAAQQRGTTIEVVAETENVSPAAGSAAELREVLVNLIFNAVDAMPEGGRIVLHTHEHDGRVIITVSDNGTGMSESVRSRIFEPFFTTKGARGNGLGLSASYGIISRLGGSITVDSALGQGTTFTIELPAGELHEPRAAAPEVARGPLDLLVVDDEPQMLMTTAMMLEIEGHHVVTAGTARAALNAIEGGRFDAVLTDLGMPEMNGLQLTEALRARGHTLPVYLITGWGLELDPDEVRRTGVTDILPKPFDATKLRALLASIPEGAVSAAR